LKPRPTNHETEKPSFALINRHPACHISGCCHEIQIPPLPRARFERWFIWLAECRQLPDKFRRPKGYVHRCRRHFHFQYPATWKINTDVVPVMHYRDVFVSLNSAHRHTVGDLQVSTNTWEYGAPTTIEQLPAGTIYMDIGYWDGPWPRFGSNIREMEAADLSGLLKTNDEEKSDGLITRQIEFHKWAGIGAS